MKFSTNRKTMRLPCYQPIQMLISQKNNTSSYKVIKAVITNATKHGLFIQTSSKIEKDKVFFSYKDEKSTDTLFFNAMFERISTESP